jgi:hypothetical protein
MTATVKIIPRTGRCRDCKAYGESHGMYNIDGIRYRCDLGYRMKHSFGVPARPAEPCPRPLTDDLYWEARALAKAGQTSCPNVKLTNPAAE